MDRFRAEHRMAERIAREGLRAIAKGFRQYGSPSNAEKLESLLHPNGRCACCNEGRCDWCRRTEEQDE